MILDKTVKDKLSEYLTNNKRVSFAFLFGSYANETALKDSDLDIAVYFQENISASETDDLWDELQRISQKDVELLNLNNARETVAWQALRGVPLVIKNWEMYMNYLLKVSFDAMDFQELLKGMWLQRREWNYA